MCCIFNIVEIFFGFIHKCVTCLLCSLIVCTVLLVMLFAVCAGIALGYNYSMAQYTNEKVKSIKSNDSEPEDTEDRRSGYSASDPNIYRPSFSIEDGKDEPFEDDTFKNRLIELDEKNASNVMLILRPTQPADDLKISPLQSIPKESTEMLKIPSNDREEDETRKMMSDDWDGEIKDGVSKAREDAILVYDKDTGAERKIDPSKFILSTRMFEPVVIEKIPRPTKKVTEGPSRSTRVLVVGPLKMEPKWSNIEDEKKQDSVVYRPMQNENLNDPAPLAIDTPAYEEDIDEEDPQHYVPVRRRRSPNVPSSKNKNKPPPERHSSTPATIRKEFRFSDNRMIKMLNKFFMTNK